MRLSWSCRMGSEAGENGGRGRRAARGGRGGEGGAGTKLLSETWRRVETGSEDPRPAEGLAQWPPGACHCPRTRTQPMSPAQLLASASSSRLPQAGEPTGEVFLIPPWPSDMGLSSLEEPGRLAVRGAVACVTPGVHRGPHSCTVPAGVILSVGISEHCHPGGGAPASRMPVACGLVWVLIYSVLTVADG